MALDVVQSNSWKFFLLNFRSICSNLASWFSLKFYPISFVPMLQPGPFLKFCPEPHRKIQIYLITVVIHFYLNVSD